MRLNISVFSRTFFMMLDDIGSGITSCSKSNDAKIQTKDGTSIFGFRFFMWAIIIRIRR